MAPRVTRIGKHEAARGLSAPHLARWNSLASNGLAEEGQWGTFWKRGQVAASSHGRLSGWGLREGPSVDRVASVASQLVPRVVLDLEDGAAVAFLWWLVRTLGISMQGHHVHSGVIWAAARHAAQRMHGSIFARRHFVISALPPVSCNGSTRMVSRARSSDLPTAYHGH